MDYQVFIQHDSLEHFVASIIGMPNLSVESDTEEDAIAKGTVALEQQLAIGKFVTINVKNPNTDAIEAFQYGGRCAEDPTFDDWMEKLTLIRQEANAIDHAV